MSKAIQPVVLAVIRKEGKYLLTKRVERDPEDSKFHDIWQIPGGGLEWGELIENAVRREMREELGIEIRIIGLLPKVFEDIRGQLWHGIMLCYLCEMENDESMINLNDEASEYNWFTVDEIRKLPSFTETIKAIDLAETIA